MICRGKRIAIACAILLATPATAAASDGLECIPLNYGPDALASIDELGKKIGFKDSSVVSLSDGIVEIAALAAGQCADDKAWSDDRLYFSLLYEIARLNEQAYRISGILTENQLASLDDALMREDHSSLWSALERSVTRVLDEQDAEATENEIFTLGSFVMSSGLGIEENMAERIGALLGFMAIQRYARRQFEALENH